jgi:sugar lactone lactonase YvrE
MAKMKTQMRRSAVASLAIAVLVQMGCEPSVTPPCAPASGVICTVAGLGIPGDGADHLPALETKLYRPQDVAIAPAPDGRLFIVDWNNHRIRVLEGDGSLRIVAGEGELGLGSDDPATGRLNHPTDLTFDGQGRMVIAAWHNSRVKTVDLTTGELADLCGDGRRGFAGDGGPAATATLDLPVGVVVDAAGNLIISDQANQRLRLVEHDTMIIRTIAGIGLCKDAAGIMVPCALGDGGPATEASFSFPLGQSARPGGRIAIDPAGNLYVADTSNFRVRKIDTTGIVTTVAGNGELGRAGDGGPATAAQLSRVGDVAVGPDGALYIADTENNCVRVVAPDGIIGTAAGVCGQRGFAGDGGPATEALLDRPYGLTVDAGGNLHIADTHNDRIRVVYR